MGRLISISIAALIGMFLLLQVWLGSWRLAALSLLTPLLAVAGGLLAARVSGGTLSLGSWFGLFAVFGVAMRNGLLLVSRCRQLGDDAGEAASRSIVLRVSQERLSPVAQTACTIGLISLTFIVLGSRPGQELVHPLAIVILGGTLTGAISTLFVVPALYSSRAPARAPEPEGVTGTSIRLDARPRVSPIFQTKIGTPIRLISA